MRFRVTLPSNIEEQEDVRKKVLDGADEVESEETVGLDWRVVSDSLLLDRVMLNLPDRSFLPIQVI